MCQFSMDKKGVDEKVGWNKVEKIKGSTQASSSLDVAKFLCSIMVVTIHIWVFGDGDNLKQLSYYIRQWPARLAVPFFFITSGYFLFRKTNASQFDFEAVKRYALRIFRLYVMWSFIYLPLNLKNMLQSERGFKMEAINYAKKFVFQTSYGHLWYLKATVVAVLLTGFLLYKKVKVKWILLLAFGLYLIGLLEETWFGLIKPLEVSAPKLWEVRTMIQQVIGSTRNGVFFGFLFVSIGMFCAYQKIEISQRKACLLLVISFFAVLLELLFVDHFKLVQRHNMFLSLVPSAFFLFYVVQGISLKNRPIYLTLRKLSSLVFYLHLWVKEIAYRFCIQNLGIDIKQDYRLFLITVIGTILLSLLIIKVSSYQKLRWLKKLYS